MESSDEDIAARAEAGICAELPILFVPLPQLPKLSAVLPTVIAPAMIRPPKQRSYINEEL